MNYKIKLEIFEGPLDLLLYLVKKDHLNIYDIPIAAVTKQYMQYLELMQSLDLNIAGEFLVMAATLLQIKSKMLLPAQEGEQAIDEEDDPRQDLIRQLLEYEKFKEVAENLRLREISQRDIFKRPKTGEPVIVPESKDEDAQPVYFEASIFDLISAFSKALEDAPKELFYQVIKDEYTVEDKVHNILHLLLVKSAVSLSELFTQAKTKMEIIVTFLAILELIKLKEIVARQKELFGEIEVARNDENIIPYNQRQSNEAQQEED